MPSAWPRRPAGGPLSYLGIVRVNEEQMQLLEEARAALPVAEHTHLRAMVTGAYSASSPSMRPIFRTVGPWRGRSP